MLRDPNALEGRRFDLAVIGGGVVGAWTAWLAANAGHSVALVEAADFGGGTSANSLKVIHGGLRYLQNASFARMRWSIRERSALVRSAPGLVEPLHFKGGT
jgi:glycerol-3-phosphate dehydrogenase